MTDVSLRFQQAEGLAKLGQYQAAEELWRFICAAEEAEHGATHARLARPLLECARLVRLLGRYPEAEQLCCRSLTIAEREWGAKHVEMAAAFHVWASILLNRGAYKKAETTVHQAIALREELLGGNHPDTGHSYLTLGRRKKGISTGPVRFAILPEPNQPRPRKTRPSGGFAH